MESTSPDIVQGEIPRRVGSPIPGSAAYDRGSPFDALKTSSAQMTSEGRLLAAARKPVDALEQRLFRQMERVRNDCDQARVTMVKRFEGRMATLEAQAPQKKMEHELAEVFGRCDRVTEIMKQQTQRLDHLDNRQADWRRHVEEILQAQQANLERRLQSISSGTRAAEKSIASHHQRLGACEECLEENLRHGQEITQALASLNHQLMVLEAQIRLQRSRGGSPWGEDLLDSSPDHLTSQEDLRHNTEARLVTLEEQFRSFQRNVEASQESRDNPASVQHDEIGFGGCHSVDIDRLLAAGGDDHPSAKALMSRIAAAEKLIEHLVTDVAEIQCDAKLAPDLRVLVAQLQEIAPKVIEHERQLQMHATSDITEGLRRDLQVATGRILAIEMLTASIAPEFAAIHADIDNLKIGAGSSENKLGELAKCMAHVQTNLEALNMEGATRKKTEAKLTRSVEGLCASSVDKQALESAVAERMEAEKKLSNQLKKAIANSAEKKALETMAIDMNAVARDLLGKIEDLADHVKKRGQIEAPEIRHENLDAKMHGADRKSVV